jgi:hypothetical protein
MPASTPDFSRAEPFSFGFFSSQVGTTVLSARHIHVLVLHDQPTYDQHIFFLGDYQLHLFLCSDRH